MRVTRVCILGRDTVAFQRIKRRISVGASGRFSLACEGERDNAAEEKQFLRFYRNTRA